MSNYDLSKILPHNPPMILIDDILNYDLTQKTLTAIVKITGIIANLQNSVFCLAQDFLIMHLMFLKTEKTTK